MFGFKKLENFLEKVDQQVGTLARTTSTNAVNTIKVDDQTIDTKQLAKLGISAENLGLDFDDKLPSLPDPPEENKEGGEGSTDLEINQENNSENINETENSSGAPTIAPSENELNLKKIETLSKNVEELKKNKEEIIVKYSKLQEILNVQKKKIIEFAKEKSKFTEENGNLKNQIKNLEKISGENLEKKKENLEKDEKIKTLEKKLEKKREKKKNQEKMIEELRKINKEKEREIEEQEKRLKDLENEGKEKNEKSEEKLEGILQLIEEKEKEIKTLRINNENLRKQNERQKILKKNLKEKLNEFNIIKNAAIIDLNKKIDSFSDTSSDLYSNPEFIQLKNQNTLLFDQLNDANERINDLNLSFSEFESDMNELHKNLKKSLENAERQLEIERESSLALKNELKLRISELNAARETNQQLQAFHASALHEKDALISRLSSSLKAKPVGSGKDELEKQLEQLRENIFQKQVQIETLTSENAALQFQLERLKNMNNEREGSGIAEINIGGRVNTDELERYYDDDDSKSFQRITPLMTLAPSLASSPSFFPKLLVKVANHLDRWTTSATTAFRTHPSLRVIIMFYMIIIHLWLFSFLWTPYDEFTVATDALPGKEQPQ